MTPETEQLVRDAMAVTGSAAPPGMEADAPTLDDAAIDAGGGEPYLVGLIGGKEVGKSAIVNALVGTEITAQTSHGPGTETVIAYCHASTEPWLRALLEREAAGQFSVVAHSHDRLRRQVLLDLPDIDSRFAQHVELTRRMLRLMLYPVWVQSVEKYADAVPQQLLAKVAAGNDAANFLFCLNKADQIGDPAEAAELREDYAARLARTLSLTSPPRVYLVSAIRPDALDLPELARRLADQKEVKDVAASRQLAGRQRDRTLLAWLAGQDLAGRAARLGRLEAEAAELAAQRLGERLAESSVPRVLDDPGYRLAMSDGVLAARVARWPLLSLVHTALLPLRFVVRENAGAGRSMLGGIEALVDASLSSPGDSLAAAVQSVFAQLYQSHANVAELYARRRLWEPMPAEAAVADLRSRLCDAVRGQREAVDARLAGKRGIIAPIFRAALTVGAVLWFPFVQPVLAALLAAGSVTQTLRQAALLAVGVLSAAALLHNAVFLILWFLLLWVWLRWDTQRRVARLLRRWRDADRGEPTLNLTAVALGWVDDLTAEFRAARDRLDRLAARAGELRATLEGAGGGLPTKGTK